MSKEDIRTLDLNTSGLTTRELDNGQMEISGYGVVFNQPSQPMPFIEYIDKTAFDGVDLSNVLLLRSHDFNNILARADSKTLTIKVDDKGLFFSAILPDTTLGRDTYEDIKAGNLKGCSAGFKIGHDLWSTNANGQNIHEIQQFASLTEISITSLPAYQQTSVEVERSLENYLKEGNKMDPKDEEKKNTGTNPENNPDSKTDPNKDNQSIDSLDYEKLASLVAQKLAANQTRDDDDDSDSGDDEQDDSQDKSDLEPKQETPPAPNGSNNQNAQSNNNPAPAKSSSNPTAPSAPTGNANNDDKKKEGNEMRDLSHKNKETIDAFENFLKTGNVTRDLTGGMKLADGQVLIPQDILTPLHEEHQFPRLGSLVTTKSVKHTTGILPYFLEEGQTLKEHTEFEQTVAADTPTPKKILWNLKTYTAKYVFSQDLISDSDYDWQAELQGRLSNMKDNTDDAEITKQLTGDVTAQKLTNLFDQLVETLDRNLKPNDSNAASIILSQSAYAELDAMKDTMGRPLIQPDMTTGTGKQIKGKTVVVLDDNLFPGSKNGDANMIIAPLQKAVIKFANNEITGQFMDSYDIWYKILGMYMRCDYVQARKDLITWVSSTAAASTKEAKGNSNNAGVDGTNTPKN